MKHWFITVGASNISWSINSWFVIVGAGNISWSIDLLLLVLAIFHKALVYKYNITLTVYTGICNISYSYTQQYTKTLVFQ